MGKRCRGKQAWFRHIDCEGLRDLISRSIGQRQHGTCAGIVRQHIQTAPSVYRLRDGVHGIVRGGCIRNQADDIGMIGGRLVKRDRATCGDDYFRASVGKDQRNGPADTGASTTDNDYLNQRTCHFRFMIFVGESAEPDVAVIVLSGLASVRWYRDRRVAVFQQHDQELGRLGLAGVVPDGMHIVKAFIERLARRQRDGLAAANAHDD